MRSAEQIGRTVEAWHEYQRAQRERCLSEFLRMCQQARERGDDWIAYVDAGCPDVSTPEGARFATHGKPRRVRRDRREP